VYYGVGTATTLAATVTGTSTTITGLTGSTYKVRIRGKNSTGVSGYSAEASISLDVIVTTLAGSGTYGYADETGTAAQFSGPMGVAVHSAGYVYVADSYRIRKVSSTGVVTTFAGSTAGYADGTGTAAKFSNPAGVAVDSEGNVYVVDPGYHHIRKISPAGVVTTLAGSGTQGYANGAGTTARFDRPQGVAVDNERNVYVAYTYNNRIRKISPDGVVTTFAGSGTPGYADGTGTAVNFWLPNGVAVDSEGNVYVADYRNYRIRKISPNGVVTTLAGDGTAGLLDGNGTAAKFNGPLDVAVDGAGYVYVVEFSCIRKISPEGVVTTLTGNGTSGYADGTGTAARFDGLRFIAIDNMGNLYVTDSNNHRIRKIEQ
jgi:sugar lactone lactonase YvrE